MTFLDTPRAQRRGTLVLLLSASFLVLAVTPASCTTEGFLCGEPLRGNPSVVQSCMGANEICVCATRSCAAPVLDLVLGGAAGIAGSGSSAEECPLRYLPSPFADPEWAGRCVPDEHLRYGRIEREDAPRAVCPDVDVGGASTGGAPIMDPPTPAPYSSGGQTPMASGGIGGWSGGGQGGTN